jgi:formylglycine-generating enzyme required for sulfatase activity
MMYGFVLLWLIGLSSAQEPCPPGTTSDCSGKQKDMNGCCQQSVDRIYEQVLIPNGSFDMGCTVEQGELCFSDEKPSHKVTISRSFYMMKTEVTQKLYQAVIGSNPSKTQKCGENCPVDNVSWLEAVRFANTISEMEGLATCYVIKAKEVSLRGLDCNGWRLPTEAEWEYAARGGQSFRYAGGDNPDEFAWYGYRSKPQGTSIESTSKPVCGKKVNGYELCDMTGNVAEWVWDWLSKYEGRSVVDPISSKPGYSRVIRGGSWQHHARRSRVSSRSKNKPFGSGGTGFRLVRSK